jgi:hypothetical protein
MGAGASTQGQPGSPKEPRSPGECGPDYSKVRLTAPDKHECVRREGLEVYYCGNTGELGLRQAVSSPLASYIGS